MASAEAAVETPEIDEGYTRAEDVLAEGEPVEPALADPVPVLDPAPVSSKELEEEGGEDAHKLKSLVLISGAAVAVLGAIFAIAKKIKFKQA